MEFHFTENEKQAIHYINESIFENGWSWEDGPEHGDDHWEWVTLPDMIDLLVSEGWSRKSAEGTIGSILDKGAVFTDQEEKTDEGVQVYISHWTNVYNDKDWASISAQEAETLTRGVA